MERTHKNLQADEKPGTKRHIEVDALKDRISRELIKYKVKG